MSHHHHNNMKSAPHAKDADTVEVYAPDTKTLYTVPRSAISHGGNPSANGAGGDGKNRLLVCRSYCNAIESGERPSEVTACAMGNQCRFVHIDTPLSKLKGDVIHVHYVYRDESVCQYESLSKAIARENPAMGKAAVDDVTLMIYGPNNREPVERIPATRLLLTGGSRYAYECATNPRKNANGGFADQPRVCHCAHYYFTQTCNRGSNCSFIHVISVDPTQKADSTKPANYRRRVAQLGQPEVPQMSMSPQTNYHSNQPSTQNTPLTVGHNGTPMMGRQMGGSNNTTPTLNNMGRPMNAGTPMGSPYASANRAPASPGMGRTMAPKPLTGSPQPQMEVVVGVAGTRLPNPNQLGSPNYANAAGPYSSAHQQTGGYHSTPNSGYSEYPPQQGYANAPATPSRLRAMYQAPAPPPPPAASTPTIGTSMLPMDDVVEPASCEGAYGGNHSQQQQQQAAFNYQGPNFSISPNSDVYYQQQNSTSVYNNAPNANAPTSPMQQQYANSNRASPMGTPSTAMHKGRFAHNPYAQSPVTMQAQV